jgi:hypothetical protein
MSTTTNKDNLQHQLSPAQGVFLCDPPVCYPRRIPNPSIQIRRVYFVFLRLNVFHTKSITTSSVVRPLSFKLAISVSKILALETSESVGPSIHLGTRTSGYLP